MAIIFDRDDRVATITINRPEAMNALDPETQRELTEALLEIDRDERIWCGIITGAGEKSFSAGADLKRVNAAGGEGGGPWEPWRPYRPTSGMFIAKPLIAAVNGYCLAGGLELAEACDIRIAATHAQFGTPEVKWSLLHGYGALRLAKSIPLSFAMDLLLTGEFIGAEDALRIGLVSRVVPADQLMPTARAVADRICANAPLAVRVTKELALRGQHMSLEDGLRLHGALNRLVAASEDAREGPRAFTEKRPARFKGR
ncbi:MAG: enoyl-CoA hydratase-related protein [Dehalococcoidia bacterium]